jgi:hypothetical protein
MEKTGHGSMQDGMKTKSAMPPKSPGIGAGNSVNDKATRDSVPSITAPGPRTA